MKVSDEEIDDLEKNEEGFFTLWSKVTYLDSALLFLNSKFPDDLLFNRVSTNYLQHDYEGLADKALEHFRKKKIRPTFFIAEHQRKLKGELLKKSFRCINSFNIMRLKRFVPFPSKDAEVSIVDSESIAAWINTYMKSFDIDAKFRPEVSRRAIKCLKSNNCTLYIARIYGEPAGTSLTYIGEDVAGFYCIGTVPKFRGIGVASLILGLAIKDAEKQSHLQCLQNLESDDVRRFYEERGFETVFAKKVYQQ
ncbi:MAG: GNAT family N-acetyltransferase [Thaumarchaeota archaeon]|nr:GNAT family N-acetyltransferase [Nitrososphaerota archaeon]